MKKPHIPHDILTEIFDGFDALHTANCIAHEHDKEAPEGDFNRITMMILEFHHEIFKELQTEKHLVFGIEEEFEKRRQIFVDGIKRNRKMQEEGSSPEFDIVDFFKEVFPEIEADVSHPMEGMTVLRLPMPSKDDHFPDVIGGEDDEKA